MLLHIVMILGNGKGKRKKYASPAPSIQCSDTKLVHLKLAFSFACHKPAGLSRLRWDCEDERTLAGRHKRGATFKQDMNALIKCCFCLGFSPF